MPAGQLDGVIRQLRKVALLGRGAELDDAQLLERFIARRDDGAFAVLVRRHGPMVLGVCQRVLRNRTDAEDAFQATFVVFVRKAASIRPRAKLASWLYGVAHKTALKAKAMDRKRRIKERAAGTAPPPNARDDARASLLEILDDELSVLPEKYRTPIVLCDLEGLSYREAAARLGCPQGTLSGRLTRARVLLARRIARHDLTFSAGALATLLAGQASAAITPFLLSFTIRAGAMLATRPALAAGAVSGNVAALAEGVMKMMLLSKLKVLTGVFLLVTAAVVAGWLYADDAPTPLPRTGAAMKRTESPEAEFIFLCADRGRKAVSLVVAGTSAPVLSLPVTDDLRVLIGERRVSFDRLRSGTQVAIRMDAANRAIQEIRSVADVRHAGVAPKQKPSGDIGHTPIVRVSAAHLKQLQPPTTEEVLRVLPYAARRVPGIYEEFRDDVNVTIEVLLDKINEPRLYPLLGRAQLHQRHFKCTVCYTETVASTYPVPFRSRRPRVEVVYIDKDYFLFGE
jgi:RNA polymerase sigma factor (sigma-70 family)